MLAPKDIALFGQTGSHTSQLMQASVIFRAMRDCAGSALNAQHRAVVPRSVIPLGRQKTGLLAPSMALTLRAIGFADVRFGFQPPQSGSPLRGVRNDGAFSSVTWHPDCRHS
jgi:hypothetical protein